LAYGAAGPGDAPTSCSPEDSSGKGKLPGLIGIVVCFACRTIRIDAQQLYNTSQQVLYHVGNLPQIAVFVKRGPNRDTYQLKKDYTLASHQQQAAGGADAG
jgi:hypothetical protein